jgi:hypothetical protein
VSEDSVAYQNDHRFHAVQCASGTNLSGWGCVTRPFDRGDSRGTTETGDWDPGAFKGECADDELLAGVSVDQGSGHPHSLLCCTRGAPPARAPFRDTSTMRDNGPDWDSCHGKATCAPGEGVSGISEVPGDSARTALCRSAGTARLSGQVTATLTLDAHQDQRRAQRMGDWAPGYYKLECGIGEYINAVSEDAIGCQNDHRFHAVQCASTAQPAPGLCHARAFDSGEDRGANETGDWDIGAYKGECADDEILTGVSVDPGSGRPHSLLCCNALPSLETLAATFAPALRFDGAASSFPMSAQEYYDDIVVGAGNNPVSLEERTSLLTTAPTYYEMVACGDQIRIMYWWFYGLQHSCAVDVPGGAPDNGDWNGYHNGDWERVMVTLSEDKSQVAAVTYWQHGGRYSRLAARSGFEILGTHPVVYAGQVDHGSFHDQGGAGGCLYWDDYRNFWDTNLHLDTWNNLVSLDVDQEPWMTPDRAGGFSWGYGGVNTHPTTDGPSCSMPACVGESTFDNYATDGCYRSQCEDGDDDTGVGCIAACQSGYTTYPLTCTNWNTWNTYDRQKYGYDYSIPTSNLGLLVDNPY